MSNLAPRAYLAASVTKPWVRGWVMSYTGTPERGGGSEGQAPPLPFSKGGKGDKGALLVFVILRKLIFNCFRSVVPIRT